MGLPCFRKYWYLLDWQLQHYGGPQRTLTNRTYINLLTQQMPLQQNFTNLVTDKLQGKCELYQSISDTNQQQTHILLTVIKDQGDVFADLGKGNNMNCRVFFPCLLNRKNIHHKAKHQEISTKPQNI